MFERRVANEYLLDQPISSRDVRGHIAQPFALLDGSVDMLMASILCPPQLLRRHASSFRAL